MKNYFVAIYSNFEGINKLFSVSAETEFEAMKKALIKNAVKVNESYSDWVNSFQDTQDLLLQTLNSDLVISNVILNESIEPLQELYAKSVAIITHLADSPTEVTDDVTLSKAKVAIDNALNA